MVLTMNMSADCAGRGSRVAHHQITAHARRDRRVTIIRGVPNHDGGTDISGTIVPRRALPPSNCAKQTGRNGESKDVMRWLLMLENTRPVVESSEHLAFTNEALAFRHLGSFWAGSEK
jgi:hypothetical protein